MAAKEKTGNAFVETIKTIVYALLIAGVFRTLFFQPFWIPSGSMKETLLIGDFLFVNKMAYGYSYASCPSIMIPRFGIEVDAKDICGVFGVVSINGTAVKLRDDGVFTEEMTRQGPQGMRPRCENGAVGEGGECKKSRQIETLPNGVEHAILNIGNQASDNTGVYTVPEGNYFFMGDNRDNSADSRLAQLAGGVGFVPFENLIGRADRIVFSSAGRSMLFFWTWRSDRFFKAIK